jgi:hypothetical protein
METVGREKGGRSGADYIQGRVGRIHSCFGGKGLEVCLEEGFANNVRGELEGSLANPILLRQSYLRRVGASLHQGDRHSAGFLYE